MKVKEPTYFDLETVLFLRETLEDAWACVPHEQRVTITKSELAERILKTAAKGERDRGRLVDAALIPLAPCHSGSSGLGWRKSIITPNEP